MKDNDKKLKTYEKFWSNRWRDFIGTTIGVIALEIWFFTHELRSLLLIQPFVILGGLGIFYYFVIWRPLKKLRNRATK